MYSATNFLFGFPQGLIDSEPECSMIIPEVWAKSVLSQRMSQIFVKVSPKLSSLVELFLEYWVVGLSMESVFFRGQIKPDPWHLEMYFGIVKQESHLQIDSKQLREIVALNFQSGRRFQDTMICEFRIGWAMAIHGVGDTLVSFVDFDPFADLCSVHVLNRPYVTIITNAAHSITT